MTAPAFDAVETVRGRGRPSAAELSRSLDRARARSEDLGAEVRAERLEGRQMARRVFELGTVVASAGEDLGSPSVMQFGAELTHIAARYLRQRSSSVL